MLQSNFVSCNQSKFNKTKKKNRLLECYNLLFWINSCYQEINMAHVAYKQVWNSSTQSSNRMPYPWTYKTKMKGYFLEEMMILSKTFLKILFPELLVTTIIKHYQEIISLIIHSIDDIEQLLIFTAPKVRIGHFYY